MAPILIAYLGPEATYTHQAALQLSSQFPDNITLKAFPTISSVFTAVQSGQALHGVVPFENSSNGAVLPTLDLFANLNTAHPDVHITGETFVDVHHCLLGHSAPGDVSRITTLFSHPQAWGQCRGLLDSKLSSAARLDTTSTAAAAAHVASLRGTDAAASSAAIASRLAADVHGLDVLAANIEDNDDNQTRFLLLSNRSTTQSQTDVSIGIQHTISGECTTEHNITGQSHALRQARTKALLHFRVPSHTHPGALAEALAVFGRHGLSLSSMYTRPDPCPAPSAPLAASSDHVDDTDSSLGPVGTKQRWRYIFFVEFTSLAEQEEVRTESSSHGGEMGSEQEAVVNKALDELRRCTRDLRVCGRWRSSYHEAI